MCYCPTPTLHLNLALTGDGAFLLSPKKTHTVWFISILNYGDTENVLINHLLLVIPMSYPCHYTNLCPHKPHKHAHTHTHTHTHTHIYIYTTNVYILIFVKKVFYAHQGSIYLIKNTVKNEIWNIMSKSNIPVIFFCFTIIISVLCDPSEIGICRYHIFMLQLIANAFITVYGIITIFKFCCKNVLS